MPDPDPASRNTLDSGFRQNDGVWTIMRRLICAQCRIATFKRVLYIVYFDLNFRVTEKQIVSIRGLSDLKIGGLAMKSQRKGISLMVMLATLLVFAMAAPVMADGLVTFEGMINSEGKFEADDGREYWLKGHNAAGMEQHVGRQMEITGLLREYRGTSGLTGPSIEVYSVEWVEGKNYNYMR
jgi:hypothetical protein